MEVQPGTLSLTILGGGSNNSSAQLDSGLDSLFKNSAGPSSVATPPKPVQDVGELLKQAIKQKKAASQSKEQDSAKKTRKRKAKEVDDDDDEEGDKENDSDEEQQQRRAEAEKEKERRTVFVGNVPKECIEKKNQKALKRKFAEYGQIESMRFRSIAFSEPIHRKAAFINKKLHSDRHALNAYIVFKTKEAADNALAANGHVFMDRHLRVDNAAEPKPHDRKRSVFLGSLPLDVEEEELWEFFKDCGEIEGVRVVRDKATNLGKGIGYVEFKSRESVALALALDDKTFRDKGTIRVQKCKIPGQEKTKTKISPKQIVSGGSKSKLQQQRHQQTSSMKKNQKKNSKEAAATKTPKAFEGVRASKKVGELHNKKNKTKSSRKKQKRS